MWCKYCRQDVPARASGDKPGLCCPRCGEAIHGEAPKTPDPPPAYDGWEIDEQLRHIGRALHTAKKKDHQPPPIERQPTTRFDLPHAGPTTWHVPAASPGERPKPPSAGSDPGSRVLTWLALLLGTMNFVCGGMLLTWSMAAGRPELWSIGLPIAIGGQIVLLIGLVLQVDRLWSDNRTAAAKLNDVDEQLGELKATTTLLGTSQGSAASVFYSHFAGGASPQLLLTDLKSQLDLLAIKIAQDER
jgi:hypothetical protein